jgi:hypothetical protein
MQISEPYDNSFWEKSNPEEERKKRNKLGLSCAKLRSSKA